MGRLVAERIASAGDLDLVACFDPGCPGVISGGLAASDDPEAVSTADVVVEFTHPGVVMDNLSAWRAAGLHAVVGTSGFDEARLSDLTRLWGDGPPNCFVAPNFSIGAVVMMRLSEVAAPHFAAAEIIELHHDGKADAPSGTALATARRIGAAKPDQQRQVESAETAAGARGATVAGVSVHSVRLPGLVAHQEVVFGAVGETVTIRHDTTDRAAFMPGVLLAIRSVADLPDPVTVGLERLLGI
jgi:4-hydroxy-tetrahydrodipicolinate reductase